MRFAVGSAVIVWIMATYYLHAPPGSALLGVLGAVLWIATRARRARLGRSIIRKTENEAEGAGH
jgi:hypothetical protein